MTGLVLVIAHAGDAGASAVAAWLANELGAERVGVARPEALSLARWSHRVDAQGRASTRIVLPRMGTLDTSGIGAVLNRIRHLAAPRFRRAPAKDREYAGAELQALVASWLAEHGDRVVPSLRRHPCVMPGLPWQHWASAAAAHGLPVRSTPVPGPVPGPTAGWPTGDQAIDVATGPTSTVLVAGDRVGGALADRHGRACRAMAASLGFPLLEFRFAVEGARDALVAVDPFPALDEAWAAALAGGLLQSLARMPRS